jgi:endonuclease I
MKHIYILFILLFSINATAQIPADYYDSANGLSGFALKTQLKNITTTGHFWSSSTGYDDLYSAYVNTHSDNSVSSGNNYENDGTILDFYSENPLDNDGNPATPTPNNDPYNYTHFNNQCGNQSAEGDCYNREHLVPQSSFGSAYPMYSDIHHVIPTDGRVNNFRGSYPFGNVASANWTSLNGSRRGTSAMAGYSGIVFEPIDEFKGDIARALLYFATRYENTVDGYTSFDMFNGTEDQVFFPWAIDVLLDWHYNVDPVDQRERDRNNAAYTFQGNANPFVDHPEYANMIWNPSPDTTPPSDPTNLVASNPTDTTINLNWTASTDNIGVTSYDVYMDATYLANSATNSFTVTGLLPDTLYCLDVKAKDAAGNESGFSNQACETTTNNGSSGNSTELFFSEYMEGGSNNKALEIANFTGAPVNLSIYTIKASFNGSGAWGSPYSFPGGASISSSDVYVVANSSLAVCTGVVDNSTNNSVLTFNGNDAIGLFKNDILIDMIGVLGSSSNFAQNVTLVRKPEITTPVITYNANEWNSFAQDTCSDLGSHNQTLSIDNFNSDNFKIYPNPVKSSLYINLKTPNVTSIEIYSILGKKVLVKVINDSSEINTEQLSSGVYIMKITQNNTTISKKLIKN